MLQLPGPSDGLRIGLFGGSFNPAHSGHRHVAETALKRLQLDWVWWIVARGNPLKSNHGDFASRAASAVAMANHPRMCVSTIEYDLGLTYTVDTLAALKSRAPTAKFVWLMGADSLRNFHMWKDWQTIAHLAPTAIIARPGAGQEARQSVFAKTFAARRLPETKATALADQAAPAWAYITAPLNPASSTALRAAKAKS
ncbi:UNVERIFIED_CONTAM: hypothetical protein GTU68_016718 [Idotea baltica]|nr:hypothetical protein [Idotea baltica]